MSTHVSLLYFLGCTFPAFRGNTTLIIPSYLSTSPSFSRHFEHRSSEDHDTGVRDNLCFTDRKIKALILRVISLSYRSLGKYHINNKKQGDQTALPRMPASPLTLAGFHGLLSCSVRFGEH